MASQPEVIALKVKTLDVPTKIYREYRHSVRASIGKRHAILRLPRFLRKNQERQYLDWMQEWLEQQFDKNKSFKVRFQKRVYVNGDVIEVGDNIYTLELKFEPRKTLNSRLLKKVVSVKIPEGMSQEHWQEKMPNLISRAIAGEMLPHLERRIAVLNHQFFQKPIKKVRLKYNVSNWGSCSSKGNINLSTRILFAPDWVQDYIIIHELAHLSEMNHSQAFWRLVENAMPNYKRATRWLKENGHLCYF